MIKKQRRLKIRGTNKLNFVGFKIVITCDPIILFLYSDDAVDVRGVVIQQFELGGFEHRGEKIHELKVKRRCGHEHEKVEIIDNDK